MDMLSQMTLVDCGTGRTDSQTYKEVENVYKDN